MPSIIRPAMAKYKMRILVFSTRMPPRFCIKMALIASVALITPSAVETERTCTTPRTIFNKIIPNSVEPIARKTSMVTTATNAFGAVAYSKNCATIIANAKSISVRPEKRSINLYENKMTGSSTIVLKNSTVPTAPVGMPSSCNKMGLYVILRFEQPEKTNPMMTNKMYIGAQRNENCLPAAAFAASVSAQWTTGITTAQELASAMAFGKMLYRDPTFWNGNNGVVVYNNSQNGMVTVTRQQDATAPNDSKYVLKIQTSGSASPRNGGFYFGAKCGYRKVLVARIIAKIPAGRNLCWATNSVGTGGSHRWLTSNAGTGDWKEYVYKVVCGTADFSSTHFFYVDGTQGTSDTPVIWYVAYATVFDLTSTEKYTTTIDANGIYTGTVRANQIIVDSALTVGGSSYNGSISVKDANNSVKVTLDRNGITAVSGKIGGWILGTSALTASAPASGHRIVMGASGYIYHDNPSTGVNYWALNTDGSATFGCGKISFANDGSGYLANQNIKWDASGNVTMTGTINANAGTIGGFVIGQGRIGSTATGTGSGGGLAIYDDLFRVGDTISYVLFGSNTIPASAGGSCATGRIVNNKVNSIFNNNYGLYIDVKNGNRNYGIWSNASVIAPACIGNKIKNVYFTGSGYTIDFSQFNIFFVYANQKYSVTLPSASSVATMFGYSTLPSDFACIFTLIYNYNWGNSLVFTNIRNHNGDLASYTLAKGDSITVLCANYPSFHYQILNHSY